MITKATFVDSPYVIRNIAAPIGAGLNTISAAHTMLPINQYNSVWRMIGCADRTDLGARGISTMIAQFGHKETLHDLFIAHTVLFKALLPPLGRIDMDIFILIDLISFYPCTKIAFRDLVF
jgi:hypothetical protein